MRQNADILQAIKNALKRANISAAEPVSLHEPWFGDAEVAAVTECIRSGWASTSGTFVDRFEARLCEVTGAPYAIACVNGTAALHIMLLLAGVEPDDEVIVPALTFVATAAAVRYCGAVPHFVDIAESDFGIDPERLDSYLQKIAERDGGTWKNRATGRRIAAILPVHCFGYFCQIEKLISLGERLEIPVLEDAAEALGSRLNGRSAGTFGLLGALSFNGNKIITTGGGGAILTSAPELAKRAKHLTTTAKVAHHWAFIHDMLGYNYRLPSLNAALGVAQLDRFDTMLARKLQLHESYRRAFAGLAGVRLLEGDDATQPNHWLNTVVISGSRADRNAILEQSHAQGLMLRPVWELLPTLQHFANCPNDGFPTAVALADRTLSLPSSEILGASL
jgi:perosamine synthetase